MFKKMFFTFVCFLAMISISFAVEETVESVYQFDLTYGLIAYYPFNGNADDESGNFNDGIVYNAVLSADRYGESDKAYSFDGDGDYIEVQHSESFNFQDEISIAFWIKRNEDQSLHFPVQYKSFVLRKPGIPTRNFIGIQLYDVGNMRMNKGETGTCIGIEGAFEGACNNVTGEPSVVPLQVWTHYVFTIDAEGNTKLFENGALVDEGFFSPPLPTTSDPLRIGMENNANLSYNGLLDEIAIYNRALTEEEVQELKECNGAITIHPSANAGIDQTVGEGALVTLNGSNSSDPDNGIKSYLWAQTGGTVVTLSDDTIVQPTFTAPEVGPDGETLTFVLTVADNSDHEATDITIVNVNNIDDTPPTGTLAINSGKINTISHEVTITLTTDDASHMSFSNDGISYSVWEPYANSKDWVLSAGDGVKSVYVKLKDAVGNVGTYSDTIILDSTPPAGNMVINNDADYSTEKEVAISLTTDNAAYVCFSNDGANYSDWEPYTESKSWALSEDDGSKTVHVKYKDEAGNTFVISQNIILDATSPLPPVLHDLGILDNNQPTFNWNIVSDADHYILEYADNPDFQISELVDAIGPSEYELNSPLKDGIWYWRVFAVDVAGNESDWSITEKFTIDTTDHCYYGPEKTILQSPSNGAIDVSLTPVLTIQKLVETQVCNYPLKTRWRISKDADFKGLIAKVNSESKDLDSYQISELMLEPNTTYYWKVRFLGSQGNNSEWSNVFSFTTQPANGDDGDDDGIIDEQEVDKSDDLDNDGTPDNEQDIEIKSFRSKKGDLKFGIRSSNSDIICAKALHTESVGDDGNKPVQVPYGLMSYRVEVPQYGAKATIKIFLSKPAPKNAKWVFYDSLNGWLDFSEHAVFNNSRTELTVEIKDGGYGDNDYTENKIIVDPSGIGIFDSGSSDAGGGGGGGSCFISTIVSWQ